MLQLITLTTAEMQAVSNVHRKPGMHRSLMVYHAPDGTAFGWTYEQLGWSFEKGGVKSGKSPTYYDDAGMMLTLTIL